VATPLNITSKKLQNHKKSWFSSTLVRSDPAQCRTLSIPNYQVPVNKIRIILRSLRAVRPPTHWQKRLNKCLLKTCSWSTGSCNTLTVSWHPGAKLDNPPVDCCSCTLTSATWPKSQWHLSNNSISLRLTCFKEL